MQRPPRKQHGVVVQADEHGSLDGSPLELRSRLPGKHLGEHRRAEETAADARSAAWHGPNDTRRECHLANLRTHDADPEGTSCEVRNGVPACVATVSAAGSAAGRRRERPNGTRCGCQLAAGPARPGSNARRPRNRPAGAESGKVCRRCDADGFARRECHFGVVRGRRGGSDLVRDSVGSAGRVWPAARDSARRFAVACGATVPGGAPAARGAAGGGVDGQVPRAEQSRTVSGPGGSSTQRSCSGDAVRPGKSRRSFSR